ncbi:MAG: GGDEF domain-containing protein [Granulosicoccus sp.]|nr:GGDEF domain-containing protein [Granulosicoccus sp.]
MESAQSMPTGDIWDELAACTDLPSPPGISVKLMKLAQQDEFSFTEIESLVLLDQAIAAKLLRLANSSFYARSRKTENLRQAIGLFGLNGTLTIALAFSLVKKPTDGVGGFDHNKFWLRSLASATICKKLSQLCSAGAQESFYLAGLLQDCGMLALASIKPELYDQHYESADNHEAVIGLERQALGVDHSEVGVWLLERWQFPEIYIDATRTSHCLCANQSSSELRLLDSCVALSSYLADFWCFPHASLPQEIKPVITDKFKLDDRTIQNLLMEVNTEIGEVSSMFDLSEIKDSAIEGLLAQARETLTLRSLMTEKSLADSQHQIDNLELKTENLERKLEYDTLTGAHTRAYAYSILDEIFTEAQQEHFPIALVFIDLDDFKQINDQYGHSIGDKVLSLAASQLRESTRPTDIISRIGGEEFLIIMANTGYVNASMVCDRLVKDLSDSRIAVNTDIEIQVTASVGLSVHGEEVLFKDPHCLIDSADMACYRAKHGGKNRWIYAADQGVKAE